MGRVLTFTPNDLWHVLQLGLLLGACYLTVRRGLNGLGAAMKTLGDRLNELSARLKQERLSRTKDVEGIKASFTATAKDIQTDLRACQAQRNGAYKDIYDKLGAQSAALARLEGQHDTKG